MDRVQIERLGGLAGFGSPGSRLKSRGEVAVADLAPGEQGALEALFQKERDPVPPKPDGFRYRITRQTPAGPETIEVPEDRVPMALKNSVKDVLD